MTKFLLILFYLGFLFASGCSGEAKKDAPVSTAPAMEQSPDEHISGDETSADHLSGAPSSDSHLSGN
jgi:hypothetical protein